MNNTKILFRWIFDGTVILAGLAYALTADLSIERINQAASTPYSASAEPGAMILAGIGLFALRALVLTQNSREYA